MARKDLSRTVIEGGRAYYNCWERRASHGVERATTRAWLDQVAADHDEAEATAPPRRPHVHKAFHDKLGPAHRWLAAQVGRPWSKVYAELCARFDTRTVAGRHVVHDHMLPLVIPRHGMRTYHSRHDLVVDRHGILRKPRWFGHRHPAIDREARAWAAGRVCARTFRGWWWFRCEPRGEWCQAYSDCPHAHLEHRGHRYHAYRATAERAMSRGELRYLERLPDALRRRYVIASPWPAR